jgi:methionine synthase II (cobalamin-independent)
MGDSKVDLLQSEAANTKGEHLDKELMTWKEFCPEKDIAVGAATPYNGLETIEDVDRVVTKALKYVPPEKLAITTDEGVAGHGTSPRQAAFDKLRLVAMSAQKARRKILEAEEEKGVSLASPVMR